MDDMLMPCPFCGAAAEMRHSKSFEYFVRCIHCGARTRFFTENENGARDSWNKRASDVHYCSTCSFFEGPYTDAIHRCDRTSSLTAWNDFCSRWDSAEPRKCRIWSDGFFDRCTVCGDMVPKESKTCPGCGAEVVK